MQHRVRAWLGARDPWSLAGWLGLALLLVLVAVFGTDAGVTWDEPFQLEYGNRILAWFRSGFQDRRALDYEDLYLYGGLFDVIAQWIVERSSLGPYETRHLLTALLAVLGIAGTSRLAAQLGGARAGFFAGAMLAITPAWVGHGLFNPKDVPFGTAAVFASLAATRLAAGPATPRLRDLIAAGLTVGVALAVRPGGVFLLAYPCAALVGRSVLELARSWSAPARPRRSLLPVAGHTLWRLALIVGIAWLIMLSAWPWAQLSPWQRPLEAIRAASHFDWGGSVLFAGEVIPATELPRSYLPVWFAITLPDWYLLTLGCGLALGVTALRHGLARDPDRSFGTRLIAAPAGERGLAFAILLLSVILPLTAALVLRPVLYDGQRHFLFLFPPLAALAGLAFSAFLGSARILLLVRRGTAALMLVSALITVVDMVQLHPYEYVYFNPLSGGLPAAAGRFETDYWGASYKEGLRWVLDELPPMHAGRATRIVSCNGNSNARLSYHRWRWPGAARRVRITDDRRRADLLLAVTRFDCHKVPGRVLHTIDRQGVPLLYIIDLHRPR